MSINQSLSKGTVLTGSVLKVDGLVLEGVMNLRDTGQQAGFYPATTILDKVHKYTHDRPTPGTFEFSLDFNSNDPNHKKLLESAVDGTDLQFELLYAGALANGVKTTDAEQIGADNAFTVSGVTTQGVATVTKGGNLVAVGDYLVPSSGDTLIVVSRDYSANNKLTVKKSGAGNITAITATANYTIKRPAAKIEFTGFMTRSSLDPSSGTFKSNVSLQVNGARTFTEGTPDL